MTPIITHHYGTDGVEITELEDLTVKAVAGVPDGASGQPFLFMKSAAKPWSDYTDEDVAALAADPTVSKEIKAEVANKIEGANMNKQTKTAVKAAAKAAASANLTKTGTNNTGGVGVNGVPSHDPGATDSAEADAVLALVTGESAKELIAAKALFLDPNAEPHARAVAWSVLKGQVQDSLGGERPAPKPGSLNAGTAAGRLDPSLGAAVSPAYLAKAQADFDGATDPLAKQAAGISLTYARLRALHAQPATTPVAKAGADDSPEIARLRELVKSADLDPAVKMQAGEVLTKHDLAKSTYDDQLAATNELVRRTMEQVKANPQSASGGLSGGALLPLTNDPRAHTAAIGSGRGTPQQLAGTGKREAEPAAQLQRLNDELVDVQKSTKPGSITDRERDIRQSIARVELALKH
jgi:hypothetical protein